MTNEQKQLLLKDLCARLPYNLYLRVEEFDIPGDDAITEGFIGNFLKDNRCNDYDAEGLLNEFADGCIDIKPYLRPMSSMSEEEENELTNIAVLGGYNNSVFNSFVVVDWLNKKMFDYRGLIPMGLALEALEEMYKSAEISLLKLSRRTLSWRAQTDERNTKGGLKED